MQKKGLSTIVTTLIIIVLVLVAIGIVWIVVRNVIQTGTEGVGLSQFTLNAEIKDVTADNVSDNVNLTVKRNPGEGEISKIKFIFSIETDSEIVTEEVSLKELEERRFNFHLTKLHVSDLVSISIVPIIKQNEKEILGNVLDKYTFGKGKETIPRQTCTPATCASLGYECGIWTNGTCYDTQNINCNAPGCGTHFTCPSGTCVCDSNWQDCNNDNTCECDLTLNTCSGGTCVATSTGCNISSLTWQNNLMTSQNGQFAVGVNVTPYNSSMDGVFGLSQGAQTTYTGFSALFRFNQSGYIEVYDGTSSVYRASQLMPYTANIIYHFSFLANVTSQRYSVYVTPKGGISVILASDFGFRNPSTLINNWGFIGSSLGTFSICDFQMLYSIPAPICTPATCASLNHNCGNWTDGCSGTLSCGVFGNGSCQTGQTCVGGSCVVNPSESCEAVGGRKCWYVDNAATGANNGSDWTNAWRTFSSMNWGLIKPGDFVYISGGSTSKTYNESWTVGTSGNATNQITIKVDVSSPNHNGIVIFDYNDGDTSTRGVGITLTYRYYITFDGNVNGESHIQINNLRNFNDNSQAVGIGGYDHIGIIIDHLTFINDNNPIRLTYATNVTIKNSIFQKVRGDAAIALVASSGSWDASKIYNNYIETAINISNPPGATYNYGGPDGIQASSGISAYNNTFKEIRVPFYTSAQHPDMFQITGNYLKIYNNDFINIGDSAIDYDCFSGGNPHDVWIYNNIFRIVDAIDPYPDYFRLYSTGEVIQSISNFKMLNNIFVDNSGWTSVSFSGYKGNPTGSGNEIKNNIFYNVGTGDQWRPAISIANSSQFTSNSFSFDGNIYYHPSNIPHIVFRSVDYTATSWISANEPHGKLVAPTFVNYVPFSISNNFRLS
ncbi:MAG: hypothetical protein NTU63_00005 [Candidatus Pacearchaeota archaeon]|nr:hypothetical protein [Candidatus Pacearchaeota archaeon]